MKVIFIDLDGVLNSRKTIDRNINYPELDPRNLVVLKEIIAQTEAKLVLISSWKENWHDNTEASMKVQNLICYQLKQFDLDIYDCTKDNTYNRGEGIVDWLSAHNVDGWCVIDDEIFPDYVSYGIIDYLIRTSPLEGLTMTQKSVVIEKLKGENDEDD